MTFADFDALVTEVQPRLARAFAVSYGRDRGQEALSEAMAYAWQNFSEVTSMDNPAGFLFRVGQSRSRRRRRPLPARFPSPGSLGLPDVEPGLPRALEQLTERQRSCVAMVHGYGMSHQEVADLLGLSRSSIQNHVERGLDRLRSEMGVVPRA